VPGPTLSRRVDELTKRVQELEAVLDKYRALNDVLLKSLESQVVERVKVDDLLQNKQAEMAAKTAVVEERCRALEKHSDRSWQVWLALTGAGLALLVALLKK